MDDLDPLASSPDPAPAGPGQTELPSSRPLVATADEAMLDSLLRLAAAAGVTPDVASDAGAARRLWTGASLVLVGDDLVAGVAAASPPRRRGVLVVTATPERVAVWRQAMNAGAEDVLSIPDSESVLVGRLADTVDAQARPSLTAAVVGGCGGGGASTFAAALGVAAAGMGARAFLLDGDPLGGGLDLVLGSEAVPGVRWPDLVGTSGRVSASSLRDALPQVGSLGVLSWDRGDLAVVPPTVMREVVAAGRRGHDVVVVDLPRRLDPAVEEVLLEVDTTYLVLPAEVRAVAAAARVAATLGTVSPRLELVVRGPGPAGLDGPLVSDSLGLPLALEMRPERGLDAALDSGEGLWRRRRGPLARGCRRLLEQALAAKASAA
jgi:secretion/DNA translocation related CpaE-like protein